MFKKFIVARRKHQKAPQIVTINIQYPFGTTMPQVRILSLGPCGVSLWGLRKPLRNTPHFYFKCCSCRTIRGVAQCYAFSRLYENIYLRYFSEIRHFKSTDAVIVDYNALAVYAFWLFCFAPHSAHFKLPVNIFGVPDFVGFLRLVSFCKDWTFSHTTRSMITVY